MWWARAKSNRGWYKMRGQSWRDHGSSRFVTVFLTNVIILSGKKMFRHDLSRFWTTYGHDQLACASSKQRMSAFFPSISDKIRWISDRFRQMSPKSSVNVDVAVFWLHCYFWSICRHRFSGNDIGHSRQVSRVKQLDWIDWTLSLNNDMVHFIWLTCSFQHTSTRNWWGTH